MPPFFVPVLRKTPGRWGSGHPCPVEGRDAAGEGGILAVPVVGQTVRREPYGAGSGARRLLYGPEGGKGRSALPEAGRAAGRRAVLTFGGGQLKYKHNDMEALEKELQKCKPESVKLIVVDGVFSMEGDLANLPEIVRLKDKYNASIMVDEAHGLGVFGRDGRGVCDHFGLTDQVDVIMGTFSKSLASIGGFVAADKDTINWLRHNSRSYIFSASNTPAATAAARAALHILKSEPERRENLWKITNYALDCFRQAGFEIGDTESPIIPLYVRDTDKTFEVTKLAFDEGIFINPVIPPACAPQDTLVRVALMATHTKEQVDYAVDKLTKCFKKLEIIK